VSKVDERLVGGKPPIPPRERDASVNCASQSCANNRGRGCGGRSPPGAQPPYLALLVAARGNLASKTKTGSSACEISRVVGDDVRTQRSTHVVFGNLGVIRKRKPAIGG